MQEEGRPSVAPRPRGKCKKARSMPGFFGDPGALRHPESGRPHQFGARRPRKISRALTASRRSRLSAAPATCAALREIRTAEGPYSHLAWVKKLSSRQDLESSKTCNSGAGD